MARARKASPIATEATIKNRRSRIGEESGDVYFQVISTRFQLFNQSSARRKCCAEKNMLTFMDIKQRLRAGFLSSFQQHLHVCVWGFCKQVFRLSLIVRRELQIHDMFKRFAFLEERNNSRIELHTKTRALVQLQTTNRQLQCVNFKRQMGSFGRQDRTMSSESRLVDETNFRDHDSVTLKILSVSRHCTFRDCVGLN